MRTLRARVAAVLVIALAGAGIAAPARASTTAAQGCDPVRAQVGAPPFGTTPCPGVRPGAPMYTGLVNARLEWLTTGDRRTGGACTFAFLYRARGEVYASTAGHCVGLGPRSDGATWHMEPGEERVWSGRSGPPVHDATGRVVGHWAYALVNQYEENPALPPDADFGLIRLNRDVAWDAQMCHFGGPTGTNTATLPAPQSVVLHQVGATPFGAYQYETRTWLVSARTHVAVGMTNPRKVFFEGYALFGDSGSPVIDDVGRAVGIVTDAPYPIGYPPPDEAWTEDRQPGVFLAIRMGPAVKRAEEQLGMKLRLLTATVL